MRHLLAIGGVFLAIVAVGQPQNDREETKVAKVGQPAPPLQVTTLDGKTLTLKDLTDKDQNVVLLFSRAHW